jgi:hypothetical protein
MTVPLLALLPAIGDVLDKIFPDKTAAEAAKVRLVELAQQGELARLNADTQLATAQAETNKIEAASTSLFVSGWRPAVGWVCVLTIGFKYIGGPLLFMIGQAVGHPVDLPKIDTEELWPLLLGMLGLGAFRTVEKVKKAA